MDGTILIMDYSPFERKKIRTVLESMGNFNLLDAASSDGYHQIAGEIINVDLIIMDLAFPTELQGFEILADIRKHPFLSHVPVIFITRSDHLAYRDRAVQYDVCDYIVKPFDRKRLESSVQSILRIEKKFSYDLKAVDDIKISFEDFIEKELKFAKRINRPLSLLVFTPRHRFGIPQKNAVPDRPDGDLSADLAEQARSLLRATDTIAIHPNGDIIIVLPATDSSAAEVVGRKVELHFEKFLTDRQLKSEEAFRYSVVTFPDEGADFIALLESAFKKIVDKEMLKRLAAVPPEQREYAHKKYSQFRGWSAFF